MDRAQTPPPCGLNPHFLFFLFEGFPKEDDHTAKTTDTTVDQSSEDDHTTTTTDTIVDQSSDEGKDYFIPNFLISTYQ